MNRLPGAWDRQIQHQAEPLGGLLALLGSLYEDRVRSVAVVRGLAGYLRVLDDRFAYVPADAMVPGILAAGDIDDVIANVPARRVLLESLVDGKDSAVPEAELRAQLDGLLQALSHCPGTDRARAQRCAGAPGGGCPTVAQSAPGDVRCYDTFS